MATRTAAGLSEPDFDRFRELIRRRSGLDIPARRRPELERVIRRTVAESALRDTDALYRRLIARARAGSAPSPLDTFVAALTIGETHFFRNRPQFEALERRILPDLIDRRRSVRRLRLWSAGCASGEEPYSLAILLQRLLPDLARWSVLILATDVNREALKKGRIGSYGAWSFREVPEGIQSSWFAPRGRRFELRADARGMVTFAPLNLVEDTFPSPKTNTEEMDLILCRNVLMYFPPEAADGVLARMHRALAPDGLLLVGSADPSPAATGSFEPVQAERSVAYRRAPAAGRRARAAGPRAGPGSATRSPARRKIPPDGPPRRRRSPRVPPEPAEDPLSVAEQRARADPRDGHAAYLVAKVQAGRGDLAEAERWIDTAIRRLPMLAPAHYLRGLVAQEQGRFEEALTSFRRAAYADPDFALPHVAIGAVCVQLGRYGPAAKALDTATDLLEVRDPDELVDEGDGLTVARLVELVILQRTRMLERMTASKTGPDRGTASRP